MNEADKGRHRNSVLARIGLACSMLLFVCFLFTHLLSCAPQPTQTKVPPVWDWQDCLRELNVVWNLGTVDSAKLHQLTKMKEPEGTNKMKFLIARMWDANNEGLEKKAIQEYVQQHTLDELLKRRILLR